MSERTPIFSFENSTPSRRNSGPSRRNHGIPSRSGVDVLNSIVNQSGTTVTDTPSSRGRSSCENQTDSGIATPVNTPLNSSESGLVVHLINSLSNYLSLDRDVAFAYKSLREQQKKLQALSLRIEEMLKQLTGDNGQPNTKCHCIPRELSVSSWNASSIYGYDCMIIVP